MMDYGHQALRMYIKKYTDFSPDWVEDCMHWYGFVLTGEDAHWCYEFDGLPIDKTCGEYDYCTCKDLIE